MDRIALHDSIEKNIHFSFARSGGHGGQNVNKVETKVHASISVSCLSGLTEEEITLLFRKLSGSINKKGELFVDSDNSRFQDQNRRNAVLRLESKIATAVKIRKKRIKTHPTAASKEKRLRQKKLRSLLKQQRSF